MQLEFELHPKQVWPLPPPPSRFLDILGHFSESQNFWNFWYTFCIRIHRVCYQSRQEPKILMIFLKLFLCIFPLQNPGTPWILNYISCRLQVVTPLPHCLYSQCSPITGQWCRQTEQSPNHSLFNVHCTMYSVNCTQYTVHFTTLYGVVYTVQCKLSLVYNSLLCTLSSSASDRDHAAHSSSHLSEWSPDLIIPWKAGWSPCAYYHSDRPKIHAATLGWSWSHRVLACFQGTTVPGPHSYPWGVCYQQGLPCLVFTSW